MFGVLGELLDNPVARIVVAVVVSIVFFNLIFLNLEPSPLPDDVASGFEWLVAGLYGFDFMLPVDTLIFCFGTILSLEILFFGIRIFMWLKKHLTQQH